MGSLGTLIALAPLLIALLVVVKKGNKALKASPMTADDKEIAQDVAKAVVYIFVAAALLWWFTPSFGLGLTILWTILTAIFATVVILTVVDLPDKLDALDDRIWADGPVTPVYSKRKELVITLTLEVVQCGSYLNYCRRMRRPSVSGSESRNGLKR